MSRVSTRPSQEHESLVARSPSPFHMPQYLVLPRYPLLKSVVDRSPRSNVM